MIIRIVVCISLLYNLEMLYDTFQLVPSEDMPALDHTTINFSFVENTQSR